MPPLSKPNHQVEQQQFITNQYGEALPIMNLSLIPEYATMTSNDMTSKNGDVQEMQVEGRKAGVSSNRH